VLDETVAMNNELEWRKWLWLMLRY